MTPMEWGDAEHHARMADISAIKDGAMTLPEAQKRLRKRKRQSGMTGRECRNALLDAQRQMECLAS